MDLYTKAALFLSLVVLSGMGGCGAHSVATGTHGEQRSLGLAHVLRSQGQYDQALLAYTDYISIYPDSPLIPQAYIGLAETYLARPNDNRQWSGWEQWNYFTARDTLLSLLKLRPETVWVDQVHILVSLMDRVIEHYMVTRTVTEELEAANDRAEATQRQLGLVEGQRRVLRRERIAINRRMARLEIEHQLAVAESDSLRRAAVSAQEEYARLRRMLTNLEASSRRGR